MAEPVHLTLLSHRPWEHNMQLGPTLGPSLPLEELCSRVQQLRDAGQLDRLRIDVPVTRFNFPSLIPAVNLALELTGQRYSLKWPFLRAGSRLSRRFESCLGQLNQQLHGRIRVELQDPMVPELLDRLHAAYGPKDLEVMRCLQRLCRYTRQPGDHLRILGAMLDDTFIGPGIVVLSLYNRCNLSCAHCWSHSPLREPIPKEILHRSLDLAQIRSIVDDAAEMGAHNFTVLGDGEVMLHPDFGAVVSHIRARSPYADVVVFTNGVAMKRGIAELLVERSVELVSCSVPAVTERAWGDVNPGRPARLLHQIRDNLINLKRIKQHHRASRPHLRLNFVLSRLNYFEAEQMARFAVEVGADECNFKLIQAVQGLDAIALEREMVLHLRESFPRIEAITREAGVKLDPVFQGQIETLLQHDDGEHRERPLTNWSQSLFTRKGCFIGWQLALIKASGDVSFCCGFKVVDSVKRRRFKEIWFSPEYSRYRIAAKNLLENRDVQFRENEYGIDRQLYNHRCEKCNNIGPNTQFVELIDGAGLRPYIPGLPILDG